MSVGLEFLFVPFLQIISGVVAQRQCNAKRNGFLHLLRCIRRRANNGNAVIPVQLHMGFVQHIIRNANAPHVLETAVRARLVIDSPRVIMRCADGAFAVVFAYMAYSSSAK